MTEFLLMFALSLWFIGLAFAANRLLGFFFKDEEPPCQPRDFL